MKATNIHRILQIEMRFQDKHFACMPSFHSSVWNAG